MSYTWAFRLSSKPGAAYPGGMTTDILEVSTATATKELALKLAGSAISSNLAAGGQVTGPVASFFWHEGNFGEGQEWKVTLKTTAARYGDLEAHLVANHEWANPEVTAIRLEEASASYVEWVQGVTAHDAGKGD